MSQENVLNLIIKFALSVKGAPLTGGAPDKKQLDRSWKEIVAGLTEALGTYGEIELAYHDAFSNENPVAVRHRKEFLGRYVRKNLKSFISNDLIITDELIDVSDKLMDLQTECIEKGILLLKERDVQDSEEVTPLIIRYRDADNDEEKNAALKELCKVFEDVIISKVKWLHSNNPLQHASDFEANCFLACDEIKELISEISLTEKSPSSVIVNRLTTWVSKQRKADMREINFAQIDESYKDKQQQSTEDTFFSTPVMSEMVKRLLNQEAGDMVKEIDEVDLTRLFLYLINLIETEGETADVENVFRKLLNVKGNNGIPYKIRLYALYLRECEKMTLDRICEVLSAAPFSQGKLILDGKSQKEQDKTKHDLSVCLSRVREKLDDLKRKIEKEL